MRQILPLRFESIQTLRETSTSSTFVATDHVLGRSKVVVKAIRRGSFIDDRSNMIDTFSWYRGLQHAHIAETLDAGLTPKGDLFYVRDFRASSQLFSTKDMDMLNALLGAVDFLHSMGRVHGSIKPGNVLASPKSVQLVDAWIPQPWRGPSSEEEVRFSAPEVLKGHPRTIESDLYSVGALLYRFFSGRDLFDDADLDSLSTRYIWASPRPLTSVSFVSRTIADVVENLIHKDPARRQPAFEALKSEFRVDAGAAVRAPAIGMNEPLEKAEHFLQKEVNRLRVMVIEAPGGFGKTRYIEELRHRMALRAPNLVFSVCPTGGRSPHATLAQWFLSLFDRYCSSFADPCVRRLQSFVDGSRESIQDFTSERLGHDLVDVVASVAQKHPLVLVIEDIDRLNYRIGRLMASIVGWATRLRLCLIVTSWPGGVAPVMLEAFRHYADSAVQHISLGHLSDADAQCVASFLNRDLDRRTIVRERAGGNPLFLEEYCRNDTPRVPPIVKDAMTTQVSALQKESRRVAEILSFFEQPASLEVLERVAGMTGEDLERHLTRLRNLGLADDSIAIRHKDTRTFLYRRIPKLRRAALHARCYEQLRDSEIDKDHLAWHALQGGLFETAASLYLGLARDAFQAQSYKAAATFYKLLEECRQQSSAVASAAIEDIVSFAKCRAYLGDPLSARASLKPLLKMEAVKSDPELLSSVYSALASPFIEGSNSERIRLLKIAIASLKSDTPTLAFRYGSLANAFLGAGKFGDAEMALDKALTYDRVGINAERARDMQALVLMNRGRFKEAANAFSQKTFKWAIPLAITINLAVCLEQIGALRESKELHFDTLSEAKSRGAYTEVLWLGNLASLESKLGNMTNAQNLFESAILKVEKIAVRKPTGYSPRVICYSDAALHSIQLGNYGKALQFVGRLDPSLDHWSRLEMFQLFITKGELYLALGNFGALGAILTRTREFGVHGDFFQVERLLVRSRLPGQSDFLCSELREAVNVSKHLETAYQLCRVLIALANSLSLKGDLLGSRSAATEALELAMKGGYKVLAAQAFLRRGLAADNDNCKHSDLVRCLQEASEMGLYPLQAECAFNIGAWRFSHGDYPTARDYLFRSVSITARLAEDLSATDRKRFLSLQPHREARRLLEDATLRTKEFHSLLKEPLGTGDLFLASAYRLTSAMVAARDFGSTVSALVYSIKQCTRQTGAVVLEKDGDTTLHPINDSFIEDMKERAKGAFSRTDSRVCFGNFGRKERQASGVWVPIPCLSFRGGIYIECTTSAVLDEQEIQFLSIAAAIAGTALDRKIGDHPRKADESHQEIYGIVGVSESMKKVYLNIEVAARNSATVLIEGESGTGKELVAKAIHSRSSRSSAPFIPVDCGALPEGLIEAELFGTRKGSFTGATEDRRGLFEAADRGTIFLDEIGNASPTLQAKLLRVLQEREVRRLGDTKGKKIDVRLIAATNCDLRRRVAEGKFREDLLFRLKVLHVEIPPLRDRREDIAPLATTFLNRLNSQNGTRKSFEAGIFIDLLAHDYRGNVRELQNIVERAFYETEGSMIRKISLHKSEATIADPNGAAVLFRDLTEGRRNFWSVRDRYKRRDIDRERILALLDLGLRSTRGNYKAVASMFKIEYRRFMDFLRRNDCMLDFRPYRRIERHS